MRLISVAWNLPRCWTFISEQLPRLVIVVHPEKSATATLWVGETELLFY
jgi:hypothetical protein